jgi:hypothetical protein
MRRRLAPVGCAFTIALACCGFGTANASAQTTPAATPLEHWSGAFCNIAGEWLTFVGRAPVASSAEDPRLTLIRFVDQVITLAHQDLGHAQIGYAALDRATLSASPCDYIADLRLSANTA